MDPFDQVAELVGAMHPIGLHRKLTGEEVPHCLREILDALAQDLHPDEGSRLKTSWRIDILSALRSTSRADKV